MSTMVQEAYPGMRQKVRSESPKGRAASVDVSPLNLEACVSEYYQDVYRFAYHLAKNEADASDLTQYAYERLTMKWRQIEDRTKVKAWLQSTLYRKFIDQRRRSTRFPEVELNEEWIGESNDRSKGCDQADANTALESLMELEEDLRAPLSLFYLESYSYKEISATLGVPVGTVMSRLYRGKTKLFKLLSNPTA